MHELRLVAVSEDGTYLVLASTGRGTRFMLPVDDRLRAAVRGQFSRLGQYEIEVENPLRPKEIQARIRSGETAEAISEISGIPIERVRWFEGPVLQEREYIAQQAQRATVRSHGDAAPGPSLEELVTKRIGAHQLETGDAEWDSWKREDRTWQLKLVYLHGGTERVAHWLYEPRHNSVSPADEEAARFSSADPLDPVPAPGANVTPFLPRRGEIPEPARTDTPPTADRRLDAASRPFTRDTPLDDPLRAAADPAAERERETERPGHGNERPREADRPRHRPLDPPHEEAPGLRAAEHRQADRYEHRAEPAAEPVRPSPAEPRRDDRDRAPGPAAPAARSEPPVPQRPRRRAAPDWPQDGPPARQEDSAPPAAEPPAQARPARRRRATIDLNDTGAAPRRAAPEPPPVAAPASGAAEPAPPKRKGRGRRASVPSWDEIMFGSKKGE
ncbi:septation protein SepH [Nocardiopsis sp. YSL2]|uniref:septation protein SepH n=1 Tax=Nocardiopsis sp. YSL2 TaxID=2939492 RepID=UPI0026F4353C|nr:septation protein SepH [Nocardiopsis sp. YSL2]